MFKSKNTIILIINVEIKNRTQLTIKVDLPPSTLNTYPVIQLFCFSSKKSANAATSSGSPVLAMGCPLAIFSFNIWFFK